MPHYLVYCRGRDGSHHHHRGFSVGELPRGYKAMFLKIRVGLVSEQILRNWSWEGGGGFLVVVGGLFCVTLANP